jgi:SAM-dependent methyltransferase
MSGIKVKIEDMRMHQIVKSQNRLLERFLVDRQYAIRMADHPMHACVGRWLPPAAGERILELGCGPGRYVAMLSTLGYQVTGVDPQAFESWDIIRKKTSAQLLDKVRAEELPFADHSFECIVCLRTLLYVNDPVKALREMCRVVKPRGRIIISTVNTDNLYTLRTGRPLDPAAKNLYTKEQLIELVARNGMTVSRAFSFGFWPPIWPNLWWYLVAVWIPVPVQNVFSLLTPGAKRHYNTIFALGPG